MNILLLNWQDITHPLGGGAEVHYHEIFKRVVARGHRVTLFACSYPGARPTDVIDGIEVVRKGSRSTFNVEVYRRYRSLAAQEPFDVVVDDLNKIPFYTPLYIRKPLLTIVHHLFGSSIFREASFPAALYVWGAERIALPIYGDGLIAAVSESTKRDLISHGIKDENVRIVMNAVDPAVFSPSSQPTHAGPVIGYLGRIKQYKSVDHLLKAFAIVRTKLPAARLVVIGDGDAKPGLEKLSRHLGIADATTFTGFVDETSKVAHIRECTVVANPSAKEGWGLTVLEANACGVPVVASDVPGLRDSVVQGETGVLYPYGDIQQLASDLLLLLEEPQRRDMMAKKALAWAGRFTWDASADAMIRTLEETVKREMSN